MLSQEDIQEIQNSPPVHRDLWLQSLANSTVTLTRVWLPKQRFACLPTPMACQMENWPSSLVFHKEWASCSGPPWVIYILMNWNLVMWNWHLVVQMVDTQIITIVGHSITTTFSLSGGTTVFVGEALIENPKKKHLLRIRCLCRQDCRAPQICHLPLLNIAAAHSAWCQDDLQRQPFLYAVKKLLPWDIQAISAAKWLKCNGLEAIWNKCQATQVFSWYRFINIWPGISAI